MSEASELLDDAGRPLPGDPWQRVRARLRQGIQGQGEARRTLAALSDFALIVPDLVHLVARLVADPAVPTRHKGRLAAALAYRVSPLDLLPEIVLGPVGLVDDLALLCWALDGVLNDVPPEVLERHWAGSPKALEALRHAVAVGDQVLGAGLLERAARVAGAGWRLAASTGGGRRRSRRR